MEHIKKKVLVKNEYGALEVTDQPTDQPTDGQTHREVSLPIFASTLLLWL